MHSAAHKQRATRWRNFVHLCLVRGWKDMPTGSCKDYKEMTLSLTTRTRHTTYEIKYIPDYKYKYK